MALWTPAQITPALGLDAADATTITESGGLVSQWSDKSGNARHATPPATSPSYVASAINSLGCVSFPSGGVRLATPSFDNPSGADGLTVATVLQRLGEPVDYTCFLTKGAVNSQWLTVWARDSRGGKIYWRNIIGQEVVSTAIAGSSALVHSGSISNAGIVQFFNGNAQGSAGASTRNFGSASALTIADSPEAANRFQGYIGEIVLVYGDVTTQTRQLLEGYLAHKWGLTTNLPSNHPYKSSAPPTLTSISGVITDRLGQPCQRKVYVVSRPTDTTAPQILAHGLSDPTTGNYELTLTTVTDDEVTRVVVSEDDDPLLNDIVDRVIPA